MSARSSAFTFSLLEIANPENVAQNSRFITFLKESNCIDAAQPLLRYTLKEYLELEEYSEEKITPTSFYQILAEIERERAEKVVELRAKIVEGQLRFAPSPEVSVHENEIVLGNQRIIVKVS